MRDGRAAITVSLHTEAINRVSITEMGTGVSVLFGDDRSGVELFGDLDAIHRLLVDADRQLSKLRCL